MFMPIQEYHGQTFVVFIDISGFKSMMTNHERAKDALSSFYQIGYDVLKRQRNATSRKRVDGLFVSDCGILFSRYNGEQKHENRHIRDALGSLLEIIEKISRRMLDADLMLTTSIAYGRFDYQERIEFGGIVKNLMFGYAYLSAYLDNEAGKPKLNPGQCRILMKNLDQVFWSSLIDSQHSPFDRLKKRPRDKQHLYFYWMASGSNEINGFEEKYNDTYNLKYRGMLDVLKKYSSLNG
jgi:hypothetical protein